MRLILALILAILPAAASAGAWPRAPGETFVVLSVGTGGEWSGVYAERGVRRGLTFGLEIGGTAEWNDLSGSYDGEGRLVAFLRRSIFAARDRPWKFSAEIGIGVDLDVEMTREEPLQHDPRLRLGLHVGRGFEVLGMGGWGNLALRVEPGGEESRYGLGFVAGLRPTSRLTTSLGFFVEQEDDTYLTLAPTVAWALRERLEIQLGLRLKDDGDNNLVLGIARTF